MKTDLFFSKKITTPVGTLILICSKKGLLELLWPKERSPWVPAGQKISKQKSHPILAQAVQQLSEYFKGHRKSFTIPLDTQGTVFQKKVWKQLLKIPYGTTCSYGELAARLGSPQKARAVGTALNRNPVGIIVPCHRVIGKNGSLTGFAGGLTAKSKLLSLESKNKKYFKK